MDYELTGKKIPCRVNSFQDINEKLNRIEKIDDLEKFGLKAYYHRNFFKS